MNKLSYQTLKGFRDFLPEEARKRAIVAEIFKNTFELFGFEPLETPSLEYQNLLLGKYGTEADKLVYAFTDRGGRNIALRYDQTVPTARILSQYRLQLGLPFKRYQMQLVWRADKPQKGRYREFLQCDPDIFGSTSPLADAEIIAVSAAALKKLGLTSYKILINDRTILIDLMNRSKIPENQHLSVIQTIDKLEKKEKKAIEAELIQKGLTESQINNLFENINSSQSSDWLNQVIDHATEMAVPRSAIVFKPTLARGLDYYTSTIFEIIIEGYGAGSVGGGGRYDNLINQISGYQIPAVGVAFGFDRIVEAMEQFSLFSKINQKKPVLMTIFNQELTGQSTAAINAIREAGIAAELYPDESARLDKQLKYADRKKLPYALIIGPEEVKNQTIIIKEMKSGQQRTLVLNEAILFLKNLN